MNPTKKRYAICGVGNRAINGYMKEMVSTFSEVCEIVALLDDEPICFEICSRTLPATTGLPGFMPDEFDRMVETTSPDVILIASQDDTHIDYVLGGLAANLDVIVEKPMVTTAADCRRLLETERASKGKVTVTFNYRYPPIHIKLKEMLHEKKLGRITHVDLNWYVDTRHGASYMKRWNRMRENSGGLSIHKCTHHFDLVNWLVDQKPKEVFAYGALNYYGADAEMNPSREDGRSCDTCQERTNCQYYRRWFDRSSGKATGPKDDHIDSFLRKKQSSPGKLRHSACIFDSEIDIEDTYIVNALYDGGVLLNYSANYSCPFEGYRLAINGTRGRLETETFGGRTPYPVPEQVIHYLPLFGSGRETIEVVKKGGGHGGGDPVLYEELFLGPDSTRKFPVQAGSIDGAMSVVMGEAVWRSCAEHRPFSIDELLCPTSAP